MTQKKKKKFIKIKFNNPFFLLIENASNDDSFEDDGEVEPVEGFSWESIHQRLSGFRTLERNFPFIKEIINSLFQFQFFKDSFEFEKLYKQSEIANRKIDPKNTNGEETKKENLQISSNSSPTQHSQQIIDLFTVLNRNTRVEEILEEDPHKNLQNESLDLHISSQPKSSEDSSLALRIFQHLNPTQIETWREISKKWTLYKNGNMVK